MNSRYELYKKRADIYKEKSLQTDVEIAELQRKIDFYDSEVKRIEYNMDHTKEILKELSDEFKYKTSLNSQDFSFLFLATALQCIRWLFQPKINPEFNKIPNSERHNSGVDGNQEQKLRNQKATSYDELKKSRKYPDVRKIFLLPVPYDAMTGTSNIVIPGVTEKGKELYSGNHHSATMGHDPILGYLFGSMNILTRTITFKKITLDSNVVRHVRGTTNGQYVADSVGFYNVFLDSIDSIREDPKRLLASIVRQSMHMQSDKYTKTGLPISFVPANVAQNLLSSGWNSYELERLTKYLAQNAATIGIQAVLAMLINVLIETLYHLVESPDGEKIKEVKCRKIIDYSNLIASSSNIVYTLITKNLSNLDIGGFITTVYRICTDGKTIAQIQDEYIYGGFEKKLVLREYIETKEDY